MKRVRNLNKTITMNNPANSNYEIIDVIAERWSPRMFSDQFINGDALNSLFEAARWAASSMNYQPWRFMYARKGTAAWDKAFNCLSEFNQSWVSHASVLILTAIKTHFDNGTENFHALHDLGLSVANLS